MKSPRQGLTRHREALGFTKTRLAEMLGVNRTTVHRWEAGQSDPAPTMRAPLARALQLTVFELGELLADRPPAGAVARFGSSMQERPVGSVVDQEVGHDMERRQFITGLVATGIATALPGPGLDTAAQVRSLDASVARAVRLELRSQYAALTALLPGLIVDAERLRADTVGRLHHEASRHLAMAFTVRAYVLIKLDRAPEAERAATDALTIAQSTNDPVLVGTVLRCLAETHMRNADYDLAADLAVEAANHIERFGATDPQAVAVQGAGLLTAASACARAGNRPAAFELLAAASRCADQLRHDHIGDVVFGPTNIGVHRVAFEVELDQPRQALQEAERFRFPHRPDLGERQARYLLDIARAQATIGQGPEAVATLLEAEAIAAEEIRTHRHSRTLLTGLVDTRGGVSMELRPLAQRCGALIEA
jgi:DNA-binding XRE family transcriptional regulator